MIGWIVSFALAVGGAWIGRAFGTTLYGVAALLCEIRDELRRIRIAQEEIVDIWKLSNAVTDPLGEVPPPALSSGSEDVTPALKGRKNG